METWKVGFSAYRNYESTTPKAFWDVELHGLVQGREPFGASRCLQLQYHPFLSSTTKMKEADSSKTLLGLLIYRSAQNILETVTSQQK